VPLLLMFALSLRPGMQGDLLHLAAGTRPAAIFAVGSYWRCSPCRLPLRSPRLAVALAYPLAYFLTLTPDAPVTVRGAHDPVLDQLPARS
jgi:hypothetical protein